MVSFGQDIVRDSLAIRKHTGYLAQDPRYYEHLTARETLRYTAHFFYSGPSRLNTVFTLPSCGAVLST